MTAINAFYDRDDRFAYIASDGAVFSYADGTVTALGGKVSLYRDHRIAWAFAGPEIISYIVAEVENQLADNLLVSQADLLKAMETAFQLCRKKIAIGAPEREATGGNDMTVIAAVYLESEARPAIYRIASNPAAIDGQPVNQWHEIEGVFIPSRVPAYIADRGYWIDDAVADSRALFRAQRHHDFEGMHSAPCVGGTCSLYRVGPDGIKAWDILQFADKVGERADISDTGNDVLRDIEMI